MGDHDSVPFSNPELVAGLHSILVLLQDCSQRCEVYTAILCSAYNDPCLNIGAHRCVPHCHWDWLEIKDDLPTFAQSGQRGNDSKCPLSNLAFSSLKEDEPAPTWKCEKFNISNLNILTTEEITLQSKFHIPNVDELTEDVQVGVRKAFLGLLDESNHVVSSTCCVVQKLQASHL